MNSFDIYKQKTGFNSTQYKNTLKKQENLKSTTIKGLLADNYIRKQDFSPVDSYQDNFKQFEIEKKEILKKDSNGFDMKSAIKPLLITTAATIGGIIGISACLNKYSNTMANTKDLVRPGDLARSINIVEEPHLAMYRALRDPNTKNVLGLIGVGGFSMLTLSAKNCVEGIKEVWIKKQNCDIEYDFKKNSIDIETSAFGGKLNVVNSLLSENSKRFNSILNFRGKQKEENEQEKKKINPFYLILPAGMAFCAISALLFKNYQKIAQNLDTFKNKMTDSEIRSGIQSAVSNINKEKAIDDLTGILKLTNASETMMRENLSKINGITEDEINTTIKAIKNAQIYAQAPEALGGISEKIQYYCYVNEERGHLYNWILNPENKFNKFLFLSFCFVSSIGYMARTCVDAIKQVAVSRENSKSELNLKKKLVDVEINNFKAKKQCAILPLIENLEFQKKQGKSKEELYELAQNIMHEIKNGPPYIYD